MMCLWAPTAARAEIIVERRPLSVTETNPAMVLVEASSLHYAIHVMFEDAAARQTRYYRFAEFPESPDADAGALFRATVVRPEDLAQTLDAVGGVGRVAATILRDGWIGHEGADAPIPAPLLTYAVRTSTPNAMAIAEVISAEAAAAASGSIADFNRRGVRVIGEALRLTDITRVASGGDAPPIPLTFEDAATPLGYLYGAMLLFEEEGALSGCRFDASYRVTEADLTSVRDGPTAVYSHFVQRVQNAPTDINMLKLGHLVYGLRGVGLVGLSILPEVLDAAEAAMDTYPLVGEALVMGHIDPASVEIMRCAGWRMFQGKAAPTASILERSVIYDFADGLLSRKSELIDDAAAKEFASVRFFAAAHNVTRLFGIGTMDAIEYYGADRARGILEASADFIYDRSCGASIDLDASFVPEAEERALIRDINESLFYDRNLPVLQQLLSEETALFDPVTGGELAPPPGIENPSSALAFDLRMVLVEQSYIRDRLEGRLTPEQDARLTESQKALYCLYFGKASEWYFEEQPEAQFSVLGDVADLLADLVERQVIPEVDVAFSNYWWRVATGTAYVMTLHNRTPEEMKAYLTALLETSLDAAGETANIPPWLDRNLRNLAAPGADPSGAFTDRWTEALQAYLTAGSGAMFYDCVTDGVLQDLQIVPFELPVADRATLAGRLESAGSGTGGVDGLALAFELSGSGQGGLLPGAALPMTNPNRAEGCTAIEGRRDVFEARVASDASLERLTYAGQGMLERDSKVVILERAIPLRQELPDFAPFLIDVVSRKVNALDRWSQPDFSAAVDEAARDMQNYRRNLAIVSQLSTQTTGVLRALDITGETPESLRTLVGRAFTTPNAPLVGDDGSVDAENAASFEAALGSEAARARIRGTDQRLRNLAEPIIARFRTNETADARDATEYVPVTASYEPVDPKSLRVGALDFNRGETGFPNSGEIAALGNAVYYDLTPDGTFTDGTPKYRADLNFRYQPPVGLISAGQGAGETAQVNVPLGLSVSSVERDPLTGELSVRRDGLINTFSASGNRFQASFGAMGVPGFVSISGFTAYLDDDKPLENAEFEFTPSVAGIELGKMTLIVLEDGEFVDPVVQIERQILELIDQKITEGLSEAVRGLGVLLPEDGVSLGDDAVFRFGLADNAVRDVVVDWRGETIVANVDLRMSLGEARAGAVAEIQIDPQGIHLRSLTLGDTQAISAALVGLPIFGGWSGDFGETLSLAPEFNGRRLGVRLRGMVRMDGCERLALDLSVPLEADAMIEAIETAIQGATQQVATCAVGKGLEELEAFLGDRTLNFFGLELTFELGTDGTMPRAEALGLLQSGAPLPFVVVAPQAQFAGCAAPPATSRIEGLQFEARGDGTRALDFRGLNETGQKALGSIVLCRIQSGLPESLFNGLEISNVAIGHDLLAADIAIRGIPFLGDISLKRVDLQDFSEDPGQIVLDAIVARAGDEVSAAIEDRFPDGIDLAGVGRLRVEGGGVAFALDPASISVSGQLDIDDLPAISATVVLPIGGGLDAFDIRIDDDLDSILAGPLGTLITGFLPFPGEGPQIKNPLFGKLDASGRRWGLTFGFETVIELPENGIVIAIERVEISNDGIDLSEEIKIGINTPMYFGPIALSRILLIYSTGANGNEKGIALGADITAVEPQLARILKLQSILDLRQIEKPAFTLTADLIALDSFSVMAAKGEVDLSRTYAAFEAATSPALRDVLDFEVRGMLNGETGLVTSHSHLAVLGEKLSQNDLLLCSKDCEDSPDGKGHASMSIMHRLAIGQGTMEAGTDLRFSDPRLGAGIGLDLFGWKPGRADFGADVRSASLDLRFLGIKVRIVTPTIGIMSPGLVISILKSLLDISLEDLLKTRLDDITISVMSGNGDMQQVKSADSNDDGQQNAPVPGDAERGQSQQASEGDPPPKGEDAMPPHAQSPVQAYLGGNVDALVCEKIVGAETPVITDDINERYDIWGLWPGEEPWPSWAWMPWPVDRGWHYHWPTISGKSAKEICRNVGTWHRIPRGTDTLPAARGIGRFSRECGPAGEPQFELFEVETTDIENEETRRYINRAGLPILCFEGADESAGRALEIWTRMFWDGEEYIVVPMCPEPQAMPEDARTDSRYKRVCEDIAKFTFTPEQAGFETPGGLISAREELRFFEEVAGPDMTGVPLMPPFATDIEELEMKLPGDAAAKVSIKSRQNVTDGRPAIRITVSRRTNDTLQRRLTLLSLEESSDLAKLYFWLKEAGDAEKLVSYLRPVLRQWLASGEVPELVIWEKAPEFVVLQIRESPSEEAQLWLYPDPSDATAVTERVVIVPRATPTDNSPLPLRGAGRIAFLRAIAPDVTLLAPSDWPVRIGLGTAPQQLVHVYAYIECQMPENWQAQGDLGFPACDYPDEAALMILTDVIPQDDPSLMDRWTGEHASSLAARAERRKCTTVHGYKSVLGPFLEPPRRGDAVDDRTALTALLDPETLFGSGLPIGLVQLVVGPGFEACPT